MLSQMKCVSDGVQALACFERGKPLSVRLKPVFQQRKTPGEVHDGKSRPSPGKTSPTRLALCAGGKMAVWIILPVRSLPASQHSAEGLTFALQGMSR